MIGVITVSNKIWKIYAGDQYVNLSKITSLLAAVLTPLAFSYFIPSIRRIIWFAILSCSVLIIMILLMGAGVNSFF